MRIIADKFDELCKSRGLEYTIEHDTKDSQGYMVRGRKFDPIEVRLYMEDFIKDKSILMNVERSKDGSYFSFAIQPIYEEEPVQEDQYKTPDTRYARSQAPYAGSSINPAKTFGGIPTKSKKKKKKVQESIGDKHKLSKALIAHDNITIIPAGAEIEIVDDDPTLPDIKYEGKIINVDRASLNSCIREDFGSKLHRMIKENIIDIVMPDVIGVVGQAFDTSIGNMITPENSQLLETLNRLRADEIVAYLQYELFYITVPSMNMVGLEEIFKEHLEDERKHADMLAKRIHELDGDPVADPAEIINLASIKVEKANDATSMVSIIQKQEMIAVDAYKAAIKQCDEDPATRNMLEEILRDEEEHSTDMRGMLE